MAHSKKSLDSKFGAFLKSYSRRKHKRFDPNDRSYDRKIEKMVKSMHPEELCKFINGEPCDSDLAAHAAAIAEFERGETTDFDDIDWD